MPATLSDSFERYVNWLALSLFLAFILTLALVAVLDVVTNDTQLPADFFIKLPGLSLAAAFSVSYFLFAVRDAAEASGDGQTT
jgi:hypothetical protein